MSYYDLVFSNYNYIFFCSAILHAAVFAALKFFVFKKKEYNLFQKYFPYVFLINGAAAFVIPYIFIKEYFFIFSSLLFVLSLISYSYLILGLFRLNKVLKYKITAVIFTLLLLFLYGLTRINLSLTLLLLKLSFDFSLIVLTAVLNKKYIQKSDCKEDYLTVNFNGLILAYGFINILFLFPLLAIKEISYALIPLSGFILIIQLLQCVILTFMFLILLKIILAEINASALLRRDLIKIKRLFNSAVIGSVFLIVLNLIYLNFFSSKSINEIALSLNDGLNLSYHSFDLYFKNLKRSALISAADSRIAAFFPRQSRKDEVFKILKEYKNIFEADVIYLMDLKGKCVLSTNRGDPDSFEGKNYSFRPYFQGIIKGDSTVSYIALGVTSKKRGVYISRELKHNNELKGVLVVKKDIDKLEKYFKAKRKYLFFLTNNDGVIFMSNAEKYLYTSMDELSRDKLKEIVANRQFADKHIKYSGLKTFKKNMIYDNDGNFYFTASKHLKNTGALVILTDLKDYYLNKINIQNLTAVFLLAVFFMVFMILKIQLLNAGALKVEK